jgi:uncharacterized protein (DUF1697 family)
MATRGAAMQTYVAFMRAINVGGHAVVPMSDLQQAFRSAGCESVRTYIASGNVLFEARPPQASALFNKIERAVGALLGKVPTILFRTVEDLQGLVASDPFKHARRESTAAFYVTFLASKPQARLRFPFGSEKEALEVVAMTRLDVFTISRPKSNRMYGFPNNYLEKELGVAATTRNWSTLFKIVEFAARSAKADVPVSVNSRGATPPAPRRRTRRDSQSKRTPIA